MNEVGIRSCFIIAWAIVQASCVHEIARPSIDSYHIAILDNMEMQQFEIFLKSHSSRAICVFMEDWPNAKGGFVVEREGVFVESASGVFLPQSSLISVYCPGGCGFHRIEPGGELSGFIEYKAFGDPASFASDKEKRLQFSVSPFYCRGR